MTRFLLAILLLVATLGSQTYSVEVDAPDSGHFWATGPMPVSTPPVLIDHYTGARAYRLQTLGVASAIYGVEAAGEFVPNDRVLHLIAAKPEDSIPGWWTHPNVANNVQSLWGKVTIAGVTSSSPTIRHINQTMFWQRFQIDHICGDYGVRLWVDIYARSPVIQVTGFVAALDRGVHLGVPFSMEFGEEVVFPTLHLHNGTLQQAGGSIKGTLDLDKATLYALRFTILCATPVLGDPMPPVGTGDKLPPVSPVDPLNIQFEEVDVAVVEPAPVSSGLDELTASALAAGRSGARFFTPKDWVGDWLGVQPELYSDLGAGFAAFGLTEFEATHRFNDMRPWASQPSAGQAGSQASLGVTWFAPLFVNQKFKPMQVHLWSADDWALRPVHLFEPGTLDPLTLASVPERRDTVNRQFYDDPGISGQVWTGRDARASIPLVRSNGQRDYRTAHDEAHMAELPLVATYAATGDPLCAWILASHRTLDLKQRRPIAGWRGNGRMEGRTAASMLASALTAKPSTRNLVIDHLMKRLNIAIREAASKGFPADAPVRPVHLHNDPRLYVPAPATVPYEEAQFAWSCWLLFQQTRDRDADGDGVVDIPLNEHPALLSAYRWGMVVAANSYQGSSGGWQVPYGVSVTSNGAAWPQERLQITGGPDKVVHPSDWAAQWAGCGLQAAVRAYTELLTIDPDLSPPSHRPHIERAAAVLGWVNAQPHESLDRIHQGLLGTPVPVVPPVPVR